MHKREISMKTATVPRTGTRRRDRARIEETRRARSGRVQVRRPNQRNSEISPWGPLSARSYRAFLPRTGYPLPKAHEGRKGRRNKFSGDTDRQTFSSALMVARSLNVGPESRPITSETSLRERVPRRNRWRGARRQERGDSRARDSARLVLRQERSRARARIQGAPP